MGGFRWKLNAENRGAVSKLSSKDIKLYGTYEQDLGPIIQRTQALNTYGDYTKPGSQMWHLCDVPSSLVHKWKQEGFDLMAMPAKAGPEQNEFLRELRKRLDANDMSKLIVCPKRW